MKLLAVLSFFLLADVVSINAQKIEVSHSPAVAGFSVERLKRIDNEVDNWVKKGWINGAVGLIIRNGKIVYYKGAGYNDLSAKTAMPKEGIFRIASQTKAIASVAVMMLY